MSDSELDAIPELNLELNAVLQWLRSFVQCPRCGGSSTYSSWIIKGEQVVCSLCYYPELEKLREEGIDQLLLLELGPQAWLSDLTKERFK